jgi:hypothetical protein
MTYTITIKNDPYEMPKYAGKTYEGFTKILNGSFLGGYEGNAEGEPVIFLEDEVETTLKE